ncbi:hypothetical protein TWF788_006608 [Orbilia oligospora]|uniref:Clr5 domain-containing protein n=1 Tax=Orbilia oligospora TaxID=2813651 RepID=A0A7C8PVQ3_ORBOL|nr:hypothetical protein TWF788_006608 [Orbilia oligospora]
MAARVRRDNSVPETTPRRLYSPREWEEKKHIIARLKDEGNEQEQILRELEKQFPDFRPTLPMLKKRMRDWKLTSYHKEPDIAEAVRITADREKLNKKTVFTIGDKRVTQEEIQRYLRRKGIRNPRAWASTVVKQPVSVIQIHTPGPSRPSSPSPGASSGRSESSDDIEEIDRVSEISTNATERRLFQEACDIFVSTASREHIRQVVRGPHESQMLETAIWNTDYYCDMLFVLEELNPGLADLTSDALNDFTNGMWKGWDYLFDDNMIAFTYFKEGFASLDRLVHSHNRRFLPELLEMLLNLRLEPRVDVLQILLQRLATLYKHSDPKLYDVFLSLLSLDNWSRLEVVERLMNKVSERFSRKLGPEHAETKSIQKALTRSVFRKLPVSKAITELQGRVAEEEEESTQELLYKKCNVCIELALCYRSRGDLIQVESWVLQAMLLSEQLTSSFHQADISVRCHRVMSYVERNKGNWQAAYGHWQCAVLKSSLGLGSTDSLTVLVESELRDFVKRAQRNGIVLVDQFAAFEDEVDDFHNPDVVFEPVSEPLEYYFHDIVAPAVLG